MQKRRVLGLCATAAALLVGIWTGAHVHSRRLVVSVPASVGEASPPAAGDFAADFDPATPVAGKIPAQLPEFSLSDRNGVTTSIAKWSGKSLVVNFWATWCAPCRREIPVLKALAGEWAGREVEVVGVAVDHRDQVAAYARDLKIPYPILVGEQDALDVAAQFGLDSPVFPFTVFTDRRGQVITLYVGELHKAQADLILSVVQSINDNRFDLAEARRTIALGLRALTSDSARQAT